MWRLAIPALIDPLVLGVASLLVSSIGAPWLDPAARGTYVFYAALLIGSWTLVVRRQPPRLASRMRPPIEPGLEQVCMCALTKDPHKRFEGAADFATALERARPSRPWLLLHEGVVCAA